MWTPKRIVLLALGFVLFFTGYLAYANVLGGIDGLPPLPARYLDTLGWLDDGGPRPPKTKPLEEKLKQAFGANCEELNRPIKLELHSRRTVLAAHQFNIESDGRVLLSPMSLALFGQEKGDGRGVEINTLCAEYAYLKFDRPITNLGEIGSRKIVAAELINKIRVINNRRTASRDDDLHIYINAGPLYYDELKHLIWTRDHVYLKDDQSKPKPIEVRGRGMEMELLAEAPAPKPGVPAPRKQKGESITGVKRIVLQADVDMHLYVDGQSGFLGGPREQAGKAPAVKPNADKAALAEPPEKAHVVIKTPGKFRYDVGKDHDTARFDVPDADGARAPQDVTVSRFHEKIGKVDQLVCKHLDLRLRRKESTGTAAGIASTGSTPENSLDIETAHATGPNGAVTLTSDVENLRAHGNDFFYDAPKALTTLKGQPTMEAEKDNNIIKARELHIQDQKPANGASKGHQTATGIGPGTIDLIKFDDNRYVKVMQASWQDKLISTKDGPHDLLILTGAAGFVDYEHNQTLQADTLKVWLQPKEGGPAVPAATVAQPNGEPKEKTPRPDHVEAIGNVVAHSTEMNIHDSSRLVVWFKDVPADGRLPAEMPTAKAGERPANAAPAQQAAAPVAAGTGPRPLPPGPAANHETGKTPTAESAPPREGVREVLVGPPPPADPPRPIDLSARSVEAWVLRSDVKNTLEKLWTEGSVRVKQAPAKPDEKGVDIEGETLQMLYHPEGNFLVVTGDLAQLRMDKILIIGPEVNIDQAANKAWVTGSGAMVMDSRTNFQGTELNRTVPLTVHWDKSMLFSGRSAEFHGGIQADQENARLACQALQVFFDRAISLKEGTKSDQPARVQNLVCDRNVRIDDATYEGMKLVKFQRIMGPTVDVHALEPEDDDPRQPPAAGSQSPGNVVHGTGPGTVRILQLGGVDPAAPPAPAAGPPPAAKPPEEMKMTFVSYGKSLYANSKTNTAIFLENVRVLNFPCNDPNVDIDIDAMLEAMPVGGIYLRSERLEVLNRPVKGGRSQQEMTAVGRVVVQAKEFWGRAAKVTYNEEKDQIIFEGGDDGYASLYKVEKKGQKPQEIKGKKITYIRRTGEYKVDGGNSIMGQ